MPKILGVSELKLQIFILGPEVTLTSYILSWIAINMLFMYVSIINL